MSDAPSPIRRRRIARILVGLLAVGAPFAGVGVVLFTTIPSTPNTFVPCQGEICAACLDPTPAQCTRLTRCGGEPCADVPGADPYAGTDGRLARGLREAMERGAVSTYHTDPGPAGVCMTTLYLDRDQRAAFLRTVDAVASGSRVIDCRTANLPAKGRNGTSRRSVIAGMDPLGANEEAPESEVESLDAGPE